jgi:hypothetical protein
MQEKLTCGIGLQDSHGDITQRSMFMPAMKSATV